MSKFENEVATMWKEIHQKEDEKFMRDMETQLVLAPAPKMKVVSQRISVPRLSQISIFVKSAFPPDGVYYTS